MKKFFYFAFAAVVALANVACGDDDDDNGGNNGKKPVTITEAPMSDNAFMATLDEGTPVMGEKDDTQLPQRVKAVSVLDGGQLSVTVEELDENGDVVETNVIVTDVEEVEKTDNGTKFKVNSDKFKGFVEVMDEVATSRGQMSEGQININFTINGVTYSTNGTPVQCLMQAALASNGGVLTYVCQKFLVKSMIIECKGDVKVYKTVNGGNLLEVYNIANDKGANLTDEDKKGFNKVVKYVSVSRFGELNIVYADNTCDGGNWDWVKGQTDQMTLWLKDKGMGNKFIPENPKIDLEFSGNTCSMTIHATITGSKNYEASLTLIMDAQK